MNTTTWTIEARTATGTWGRGTAGSGPENRFATEDDALDAITSLAEAHGADESDYRAVRIPATAEEIEALARAGQLWDAARELAHADVAPCDGPTYAEAYVKAVAACCGALAEQQVPAGDTWTPEAWLPADLAAVEEAAELLGVEVDGYLRGKLWRLYQEPGDDARRMVEMYR